MLAAARMVGFLLTKDYDKARAFYEGKLGCEFVSRDQFDDIAAVVSWLAQRGVATEKYRFVDDKEHGIWTAPSGARVAWFKDPDGNVLSVSQH